MAQTTTLGDYTFNRIGLGSNRLTDDASDEHARAWLAGRPRSSVAKLAARYGIDQDPAFLSIFAHADTHGLEPLRTGPIPNGSAVAEVEVNVGPQRHPAAAAVILHGAAYEAVGTCAALAEAFEVEFEVPPWVTEELPRNRRVLDEFHATRLKRSA